MKMIISPEDFEKNYYYKKSQPDKYPSDYPCILEYVTVPDGWLGDHVEHRIFYIPKNMDKWAYFSGMVAYKEKLNTVNLDD